MRSLFSERSLGSAVVTLAALSACAPARSVDHLPPPCAATYELCPTTGLCEKTADMTSVCPPELVVRQGGRVAIPIPRTPSPAVDPDRLRIVPTGASDGDDQPVVELEVPHGAALGQHLVTIATTAMDVPTRQVAIWVSPIEIGTDGRDDGPGTITAPFQTLAHALEVAGEGDTIALQEHYVEAPAPADARGDREVPARVTIMGRREGATISSRLHPAGDVTLSSLTLTQPTLLLDRSGAKVELTDIRMGLIEGVFSPAPRLQVAPGTRDVGLRITGVGTNILGYFGPTISVEADNSFIDIGNRAKVFDGNGNEPLRLQGSGQVLTIHSATITNTMGTTAISMRGDHSRLIISGTPAPARKDCIITGKVDVQAAAAFVSVSDARFLPAVGEGGITFFSGDELRVSGSEFHVMGIQQDGYASRAIVRNTAFIGYRDWGYRLLQGHLDLGNGQEYGRDRFNAAADAREGDPATSVVAVDVRAAARANAGVTVGGTTFEGQVPPAGTITGVNFCAGWYRITSEGIPITFF